MSNRRVNGLAQTTWPFRYVCLVASASFLFIRTNESYPSATNPKTFSDVVSPARYSRASIRSIGKLYAHGQTGIRLDPAPAPNAAIASPCSPQSAFTLTDYYSTSIRKKEKKPTPSPRSPKPPPTFHPLFFYPILLPSSFPTPPSLSP